MVKNLFVTAAAAAAMFVPPPRTLPWWGFQPLPRHWPGHPSRVP
jgi:hypothetical protein